MCEFPLGQEPAAEDEDEQQKLLQGPDPLVGVQVHLDLELDLEWVPGGVWGGGGGGAGLIIIVLSKNYLEFQL